VQDDPRPRAGRGPEIYPLSGDGASPRSDDAPSRMLLPMITTRGPWTAFAGGILVACATATCGGAPAAPQAPAVAGPLVAPAPAPLPVDVSAVPEPPGLVITARLAKVSASLGVVHEWTGLPMPQSEQLSEFMAGGPLGPIVDLEQPADLAVATNGKDDIGALIAVAAAVRDPEAAKALLAEKFKLVPGDNGVITLRPAPPQPNGSGEDGKSDDDRHPCELSPAAGAAAMRLVCGLDAASLTALGPWLTRTAPRRPPGPDAHLEMRFGPMKATIGDQWRKLSGLFDVILDGGETSAAAARDLAKAGVSDLAMFFVDLDTIAIDLDLSDSGATLTTTFGIPGAASTLSRLLLANADKNGPPSAPFWQMPADADVALFNRGHDANDYARGRDLVLRVVADALATDGIVERDRHAIVDALSELATPAPMAYASGIDSGAVGKALSAKRALGDGADAVERAEAGRAEAEALLGWHVLESDQPPAGLVDAIKALALAWSRPGVQSVYRAKMKAPPPSLRSAPMPVKKAGWPAGAQHFVLEAFLPAFRPAKGAKGRVGTGKPFVVHVVVIPDGTRSWVGFGGDPLLVASKVTDAASGTGNGLASRADLADLKGATLGSGGFISAGAIGELVAEGCSLATDDTAPADTFFDEVAQLPHQADPIDFSLTARPGKPPSSAAVLHLSKGTIQGAVAGILRHGGF